MSLDFPWYLRKPCDMDQKIADYALSEGISVQRARELARKGKINAKRVGRSWVVMEGSRRHVAGSRALSEQSQADLIEYLNTRSFRHVSGHRKARLAGRVRGLLVSPNPAGMLRDFFSDQGTISGLGGASIVRASLAGHDDFVRDLFTNMEFRENLPSPDAVARKLHDARVLRGFSVEQAAHQSGMPLKEYRRLESKGEARLGNITAVAAFRALGAPLPAVIKAKRFEDSL